MPRLTKRNVDAAPIEEHALLPVVQRTSRFWRAHLSDRQAGLLRRLPQQRRHAKADVHRRAREDHHRGSAQAGNRDPGRGGEGRRSCGGARNRAQVHHGSGAVRPLSCRGGTRLDHGQARLAQEDQHDLYRPWPDRAAHQAAAGRQARPRSGCSRHQPLHPRRGGRQDRHRRKDRKQARQGGRGRRAGHGSANGRVARRHSELCGERGHPFETTRRGACGGQQADGASAV